MISAVLLSLGLALPALASPRIQPPLPAQQLDTPPTQGKATPKPVPPLTQLRGQLLYENHCMACHESLVHIRNNQSTRSLPDLQRQVRHWADYLHLHWSEEEVGEVERYLDSRYYKFESR